MDWAALVALEKTRSSEVLAKRLWMSFVVEGKEALYAENVREVLGSAYKEEADEAFAALDQDENGDISLNEMIMKVVESGRGREAVSAIAFQDTNFVTTLATAGTTLLSLSFVFAATTEEFLASCIFLFIKHPFDVGDRVDIIGPEKEFLVVEQISLLFTVFKRIDSMKMVQVPNIVPNNLWIENITRSRAMKEQLDIFISFDTSLENIDVLRKEMENFVRNPDNSRGFQSDIVLEATGIAARRSKFMCALVLALRKVSIYCPGGGAEPLGGPTNPGYSAKEDQRLVPSKATESGPSPSGSLGPAEERKATEAMNAGKPTADAARDAEDAAPVVWKSRDDNTIGERHRSNEKSILSNRGDEFISSVSQTLYEEVELGLQPMTTNQSHYDWYTVYQSQRYGVYPSPSAGSTGT
ncbi:hypothetical protein B0J14DRAFT_676771 [Halenospora varia]|nr:hypothetical protein B0J14DRAFT_676771 [Halenospora varia]